jgi:hypothetical protein
MLDIGEENVCPQLPACDRGSLRRLSRSVGGDPNVYPYTSILLFRFVFHNIENERKETCSKKTFFIVLGLFSHHQKKCNYDEKSNI